MTIKQRQERFEKVFNFLKKQGHSQEDIAERIGFDYTYINKIKNIKVEASEKFLKKMRDEFGINPDYLSGESDVMIDLNGSRLDYLEKIVESWQTLEGIQNKYLHFIMDANFYNFLIDVDLEKLKEHSEDLKERIKILKERHLKNENLKEYVLIPRNEFLEIVGEDKEKRAKFYEIIDTQEYEDVLETGEKQNK